MSENRHFDPENLDFEPNQAILKLSPAALKLSPAALKLSCAAFGYKRAGLLGHFLGTEFSTQNDKIVIWSFEPHFWPSFVIFDQKSKFLAKNHNFRPCLSLALALPWPCLRNNGLGQFSEIRKMSYPYSEIGGLFFEFQKMDRPFFKFQMAYLANLLLCACRGRSV